MRLEKIKNILDARVIAGEDLLSEEIEYGYSCDLMSDVLAYVQNNVVLITGLVHPQIIRTAEVLDIKCIVIVRGKQPSGELVEMARRRELVVMITKDSLFTASGKLFANGLSGEESTHSDFTF